MSGLGRKVWGTETLSAPELQGYLQDQVVMVFPSAAARDGLIPVPSDGMVCWLDDVKMMAERVSGAWKLRRPGSDNGGTSGVIAGNAPPAGTPLIHKYLAGSFASSGFGDMTQVHPGGPFPNGVLGVWAEVQDSRAYEWNPWGVTLGQANYRLNSGPNVAASVTVLSAFHMIGW